MFDVRNKMIMLSLKCLRQYFSVKFVLKIQFNVEAMCERTVLRMRLRISFFFDVLFDNALNTVWWIFSSVIWKNSSFSKYVVSAISSILISMNDEKKNFLDSVLYLFSLKLLCHLICVVMMYWTWKKSFYFSLI